MKLSQKQVGVAGGMAAAAGFSALVLAGSKFLHPVVVPVAAGFAERLQYVLRADLLVFAWLLASIANVARARFLSPTDIDGSGLTGSGPKMSIDVAVLQNTLEQVVLAVGAHIGLAAAGPEEVTWIPALTLLFCVGRAAFWIGYKGGAAHRAFGFATTFYPTIFGYCVALSAIAR